MSRNLVAGVDSSTQSVKIVIRDAQTGELVREARGTHPDATEVDPAIWWNEFESKSNFKGGNINVFVDNPDF